MIILEKNSKCNIWHISKLSIEPRTMYIVFELQNTVAIKNEEKSDPNYIQTPLFLQQENYVQLFFLSFLAIIIWQRRGSRRTEKMATQSSKQLF